MPEGFNPTKNESGQNQVILNKLTTELQKTKYLFEVGSVFRSFNQEKNTTEEIKSQIIIEPAVYETIKQIWLNILGKNEYLFQMGTTFRDLEKEKDIPKNIKDFLGTELETYTAIKEIWFKVIKKNEYLFQMGTAFRDLEKEKSIPKTIKDTLENESETYQQIEKIWANTLKRNEYAFQMGTAFRDLEKEKNLPKIFMDNLINDPKTYQEMQRVWNGHLEKISYLHDFETVFRDMPKEKIIPKEIHDRLKADPSSAVIIAKRLAEIKEPFKKKIEAIILHVPNLLEKVIISALDNKGSNPTFLYDILSNLSDIPPEVLNALEKDYSLQSYKNDLGIPSAEIYQKYIELKKNKDDMLLQGFIAENKRFVSSMIGSEHFDESRKAPYYKDFVEMMYPNNSTSWTTYEKNERCEDRTQDIANYKFPKQGYSIELLAGRSMVLSSGETIDQNQIKRIESSFYEDREGQLTEEVGSALSTEEQNSLEGQTQEITLIFLKALIGEYPLNKLKSIFLRKHELHEQVALEETLDNLKKRSGEATNEQYAYLLSLREFFVDNIKDTMSSTLETGLESNSIKSLLEQFYQKKRSYDQQQEQKQKISKLRPETIGLEGNLTDRLLKILEQKSDNFNLYTEDKNGDMVLGKKGEAIARIINGDQKRAAEAIKIITGEGIDPNQVYLGDFSINKYLKFKEGEALGNYEEKLFTTYLSQLASTLFEEEVRIIDRELKKFRSADEGGPNLRRKKVVGYITKNKPSAHARQVGGVCVAGDLRMWNDPTFFQMIFKDPDQIDCKGLVMLHAYEDKGKKILTASMDPSSTYLYSTDEKVFFEGIVKALGEFAKTNGFDYVGMSKTTSVRTNRTGGAFEDAMKKKIKSIGESYSLAQPHNFSYDKSYIDQDLDIIWKR